LLFRRNCENSSPSAFKNARTFASMNFIDTHAHLYVDAFNNDREAMLERAKAAGVSKIYLPHIDSETTQALLDLADSHPEFCIPMMGLHPCSVDPATIDSEMSAIESLLAARKFAAIGEIGIDLHWDKTHADLQKEIFARHIDLALQYDLPVAIHSRQAFRECFEIVAAKQNGKLRGVFHCFVDGLPEANEVIALGGFYLGIGGVLTYKNSGLDATVREIDLRHLVLETDAPYLPPVPHRGKRNESAYVSFVAQKLADIHQRPLEEVAQITTQNAAQLFGTSF
jgi:TatD DNase family protein